MVIQFHLNNEEQTRVSCMYDMVSNPFNLGDVIHLIVNSLSPRDLSGYIDNKAELFLQQNDEQKKVFDIKCVKLVKEAKYLKLNTLSGSVN